jgi:hypothetical protein
MLYMTGSAASKKYLMDLITAPVAVFTRQAQDPLPL